MDTDKELVNAPLDSVLSFASRLETEIASHIKWLFTGLIIFSFVLRVAAKVYFVGEVFFWSSGYQEYTNLGRSLREGAGFCFTLHNYALSVIGIDQSVLGEKCAHLMPGYPVFLSLTMISGNEFISVIVSQALVSVGTVLFVFLLGRNLFGLVPGFIASTMAAFYPYFVWHDTSLQETGLFTFFVTLSILLLYRAYNAQSKIAWGMSGLSLGIATLIRASLMPFLGMALLWSALVVSGSTRARLWRVTMLGGALVVVLLPWLFRNQIVVGAPIFTSQSGRFLWIGNSEHTFSHYPQDHIDVSETEAWLALSATDLLEIRSLADDEVAQSVWFFDRGISYIRENPGATLWGAIRKIWTGFSWIFSPGKRSIEQLAYISSYFPLLVFGGWGFWITRDRWREFSLIYMLFLSFMAGTAVFWAHTSHRSYLDVYLMIFAAHSLRTVYAIGISQLYRARQSGSVALTRCDEHSSRLSIRYF